MAAQPHIKLSELTARISETISNVFGARTFWVIAEVSNHTYKPHTNFHYFDLVEKDKQSARVVAKVGGRAWGTGALNISNFEKTTGQAFRSGINVLAEVAVQYSAAFGLQLNLLDIDVSFTLGQFELLRKETLKRLLDNNSSFIRLENGQFRTKNSDLKFGLVLQKIAVISSDTSAGYQDFLHTLENNPFGYDFQIDNYFALVQGEGNAIKVVEKLIEIYKTGITYDVLVIIRGGGAQTDFLIFDNYELNRAIAKYPVPIITGIGHQKNETIADLMVHTSAKTPTKVAEIIIAHNRRFEESILNVQQQIVIKSFQFITYYKEKLSRINQMTINASKNVLLANQREVWDFSNVILTNSRILISKKENDLANLTSAFKSFNRIYFLNKKRNLEHYNSVVKIMHPQNILNKGFAMIKVNNEIISDSKQIEPGAQIAIILSDAEIDTKVLSKKKRNGNEFEL